MPVAAAVAAVSRHEQSLPPDMDPYLERHWGDVHARLVTHICEEVQSQLPDDLAAQIEESLVVRADHGGGRVVRPDVGILHEPEAPCGTKCILVAEPTIVETEPETSRWIEIVDLDTGGRVVTAIEVFSPSNKSRESGAAQSSSITR